MEAMPDDINAYNTAPSNDRRHICELLAREIKHGLPEADSKVWHGHPVWFIEGNPIVGYAVRKNSVQLLFWSGQSFNEPGLKPEGSFRAAEAHYTALGQVDTEALQRWLKKSAIIQWDYKNIVKRRGALLRLK